MLQSKRLWPTAAAVAVLTILSGVQMNSPQAATPASIATNNSCTPPGTSIVIDPSGDQKAGTGNASQDILEVLIAEPYQADGVPKLVFTLHVSDVATLQTNGTYAVYFTFAGKGYFVNLNNDAAAGISYNYGHIDPTTGSTTPDGNADFGSISTEAKTITIGVSLSKVGGPTVGSVLTGIYGITQTEVGSSTTGGLLATVDLAPDTQPAATAAPKYTLVGTSSCPQPPSVTLGADKSSAAPGSPVTLTWTSAHADACSAVGDWSGSKALAGSEVVTIGHAGNNNYGLTCTSSAGTKTVTATVDAGGGSASAPRFMTFPSPSNDSWGEPDIGCNRSTEKVFKNTNVDGTENSLPNGGTAVYFGGFSPNLLVATFNDCSSPATVGWENKPVVAANAPRVFGDPILFTDNYDKDGDGKEDTGRTFVTQEVGLSPAGSTVDITDDDGTTFTPSDGTVGSGVDHETVSAGPYHTGTPGVPTPAYPHAVYYASQSIADATLQRSDDGGLSFGPGVPMYTLADCSGLHGHIKVAADGTLFVPNKDCGAISTTAVVVSEDNGTTFNIREIPNAASFGDDDPSVGVASDSKTIYVGYQSDGGHPRIAVSHDKGLHWDTPVDVGASVVNGAPVVNTTFPAVVAGDPDRAAFAYYGSTTPNGNGNGVYNCGTAADSNNACTDDQAFKGTWSLYISTTYDGGKTWRTENVTGSDPVQRGGICSDGNCRNQLDFFDAVIDKEGRVLVGWDDGCVGSCVTAWPNSFTAKATITRQSGGKRMYAKFDPVEPAVPGAPALTGGVSGGSRADLSWSEPDGGGAIVTGYNVYKRLGAVGPYTKIATVGATNFSDNSYDSTQDNFYHVTALNSVGEGPYCKDFNPAGQVAASSPCKLPGVLAVNDLTDQGADSDSGQNTPGDDRVNIRQVFIAEPWFGAGVNKLVFTVKLAPSALPSPANAEVYVIWNRQTVAADQSDRMYVALKTDATGAPSYEYGNFGPPLPLDGSVPPSNANTPTKLGPADAGSYDTATGLLTITISNSKIENVGAGKSLSGLNARSFLGQSAGPRSQNVARDITGDGLYTLVGNQACVPDLAPNAVLNAVNTPSGLAPYAVNFDASASSDPDAGDSIVNFHFDFGDGVQQDLTTPTVSHTYTRAGSFVARLTVRDTAGLSSTNDATVNVDITSNNHAPVANAVANPLVVASGGRVDLDGRGSTDADGDPLSYHWDRLSGPAVTIANLTQSQASFVAPTVTADTDVTIQLTVADSSDATSTASVTVKILKPSSGTGSSASSNPPGYIGNSKVGALPLATLAWLGLLAALRRRR